jgi:fermentation-respiration switch protein FrsA (DUF1100 family)
MLNLIVTVLVGYAVALCVIRIFEPRFVFFPNYPGRNEGVWDPQGLPVQEVWLKASDGIRLDAWWIQNDAAKFTFLAFHGNAGNIAMRSDIFRFLHTLPVNVLAVEYRGYGRSSGTPSETGLYEDSEAALRYLEQTKKIDPRSIVAYGQSLGTAMAAHLASRDELAGVVLEAPFPSASALARNKFWFLPGLNFLVLRQLDTANYVQKIHAPILIVHCTQDPVIPPAMGDKVFSLANQPKFLFRVQGYCHEEASLVAPEKYHAELANFLEVLQNQPKTAPNH